MQYFVAHDFFGTGETFLDSSTCTVTGFKPFDPLLSLRCHSCTHKLLFSNAYADHLPSLLYTTDSVHITLAGNLHCHCTNQHFLTLVFFYMVVKSWNNLSQTITKLSNISIFKLKIANLFFSNLRLV